eukprot:4614800-Alexandrium_andersonii.AAC.1
MCIRDRESSAGPVGRAGTAAPAGWVLGPELTPTRHSSHRRGVPTYDDSSVRDKAGWLHEAPMQ